jgi:hypothetical protein
MRYAVGPVAIDPCGRHGDRAALPTDGSTVENGKLLLKLWGGHPNLKHVGAFSNLDDKIADVDEILSM